MLTLFDIAADIVVRNRITSANLVPIEVECELSMRRQYGAYLRTPRRSPSRQRRHNLIAMVERWVHFDRHGDFDIPYMRVLSRIYTCAQIYRLLVSREYYFSSTSNTRRMVISKADELLPQFEEYSRKLPEYRAHIEDTIRVVSIVRTAWINADE